jgi:hypothetical protein
VRQAALQHGGASQPETLRRHTGFRKQAINLCGVRSFDGLAQRFANDRSIDAVRCSVRGGKLEP